MIDETSLTFANNEIYYNNTDSSLNNNRDNDLNESYDETYFVTWLDVGISWSFLLISAVIVSFGMGIGLELSIIVSSIRCLVQLTLMGFVLDGVIQSKNVFLVMIMSLMLVLLGAYELSFIRAKKTIRYFFYTMFITLLMSNVIIAILGSTFALKEEPFWNPAKFIPIIGILLGKSMSSIAMTTHQCLNNLDDYGQVMEVRLSLGASRYEAIKPFAIEVIRISMLPIIIQLSVIGMINIPGTMVGQLMAGSSMMDAVIYQQVIMFMITSSSALGVVIAFVVCMLTVINNKHVVCWDQLQDRKPIIQWKTICVNSCLLIKYFSISRPFNHNNSTRQHQRQQGRSNNEILSCPTEKKHGDEQLEMKQIAQVKEFTDTGPI
ncbi:hypothetical protein INT45_013395 [Circinella minor]|uniref:Uncharacterized protein n=1 Tax=Circinella minor TaxID=1195481 RepID=A0A8H7S421_9FUNG|nr:hypothetical protein INT45_013395 [Circinella minor]